MFMLFDKFQGVGVKMVGSQQVAAVENDAIESETVVNFDEETINELPELQKLKDRLSKIIEERKDNFENTLPDVACVRQNHHLLSVYCEGKIAEELITKKRIHYARWNL